MILTRRKTLALPRRFNTPKQQRGSIIIAQQGAGSAVGSAPGVVTLSGEIFSDVAENGDIVGIRFHSNGKVETRLDATYTPIDTSTDWVIPNTAAPSLYEVMTDSWVDIGGAGDGFNSAAAAEGVWIALTIARQWNVQAAGEGGSSSNGMQFDAHIRWNGGAIIDSAAYEIYSAWFI